MTLDELTKQVGKNGVERMFIEYAMLMKAKADKTSSMRSQRPLRTASPQKRSER